jgi:endogenous inhibitor of DNA gyrase (YacG/DUF329 family)
MSEPREPCPNCGSRSLDGHAPTCPNYWLDRQAEAATRWVRVACPRCGTSVDLLDGTAPPLILCSACPGRPRLERTAV